MHLKPPKNIGFLLHAVLSRVKATFGTPATHPQTIYQIDFLCFPRKSILTDFWVCGFYWYVLVGRLTNQQNLANSAGLSVLIWQWQRWTSPWNLLRSGTFKAPKNEIWSTYSEKQAWHPYNGGMGTHVHTWEHICSHTHTYRAAPTEGQKCPGPVQNISSEHMLRSSSRKHVKQEFRHNAAMISGHATQHLQLSLVRLSFLLCCSRSLHPIRHHMPCARHDQTQGQASKWEIQWAGRSFILRAAKVDRGRGQCSIEGGGGGGGGQRRRRWGEVRYDESKAMTLRQRKYCQRVNKDQIEQAAETEWRDSPCK